MISTVRCLLWEQLWRNRWVLSAVALLFLFGAALTYALNHAASDAWWVGHVEAMLFIIFLLSLLLGFAPFTLMESHGGWKLNSMVTRWFCLPVRTSVLVVAPMLAASAGMTLLICAWTPLLKLQAGAFDAGYFLSVLLAGVAAVQALAWILPRKPGQFWPLAAFLFLTALGVAILPQEGLWGHPARWDDWRPVMGSINLLLLPLFAAIGYYAARRNRCGDWPGEFRLGRRQRRVCMWPTASGESWRDPESPASALFCSETLGRARRLFGFWLAFALVTTSLLCCLVLVKEPGLRFGAALYTWVSLKILPFLSVIWLAVAGLVLAGEPGASFRTQLSPFRATLPVTAGMFAAERLMVMLLLWVLIWLPLWLLLAFGQYDDTVILIPVGQVVRSLVLSMAACMAIGAHLLVGGLPIILWGRWEGFPNILLSTLVCWAGPCLLSLALKGDGEPDGRWILAMGWLVGKLGVAVWALHRAWRARIVTRMFAVGMVGVWVAFASWLAWAVLNWQSGGVWRALCILLFLPLARPALCPLAVNANRHR